MLSALIKECSAILMSISTTDIQSLIDVNTIIYIKFGFNNEQCNTKLGLINREKNN